MPFNGSKKRRKRASACLSLSSVLQGANLVVNDDSTLLTYVKFVGDFHTIGIGALLALIGLFIIVVLHHKNIKGSILIGILATWILGMICEAIRPLCTGW